MLTFLLTMKSGNCGYKQSLFRSVFQWIRFNVDTIRSPNSKKGVYCHERGDKEEVRELQIHFYLQSMDITNILKLLSTQQRL